MKKLALFIGASLAAAAVAAPAHAGASYVGANYVNAEIDTGVGSGEGDGWNVEGAFALNNGTGPGGEIDLSFSDSDESDSLFSGTAHLYSRSDSHLIGGFAGITDGDGQVLRVGGEGQLYLSAVTLGAAVSYVTFDDDAADEADGWLINGQVRGFVTDNFSLVGNLAWGTFETDTTGFEDDTLGYGVGAEYQLSGAPLSFVASYDRTEWDESDIEADAWRVGIRWNFGGGTLKDRDRTGAGLADLIGNTSTVFSAD